MKSILLSAISLTLVLAACGNSNTETKEDKASTNTINDTIPVAVTPAADTVISISAIVANYLDLKNALTKDNSKDAAASGNEIVTALATFNKSALNPTQSKLYTEVEEDAREHAEHIGSNSGNLKHQREHFDMLSKDIYQLVKTFGGGQKLYYDHCPMYNDGKGANWISETKQISNPYYGKAMSTCGSIKEELK